MEKIVDELSLLPRSNSRMPSNLASTDMAGRSTHTRHAAGLAGWGGGGVPLDAYGTTLNSAGGGQPRGQLTRNSTR